MDLKTFSLDLARTAGDVIKTHFKLGMERQTKDDGTALTEADTKINQLVIEEINKNFPSHSILGEEGSSLIDESEYTWVCDPIDGTLLFALGIPTSVFSLALVKNGITILAVVYDPFLDRMFYAEEGKGAYVNEKRISVSDKSELKNSILGVHYRKGLNFEIFSGLNKLIEEDAKIWTGSIFSLIYVGMLVATGEFDGIVFAKDTTYDVATIKLIVEEAGGKVTDLFGKEQRYDRPVKGIIASNGILHDKLIELFKDSKPN